MEIKQRLEETIYPVPAQHPALHELSEVDELLSAEVAVPILFFFKKGPTEGEVTVLKQVLREVLAIFYPLAGRLVARENAGGRLDVSCLDQGALFSRAWASCPLSFFGPDFQPHPSFHLLSPRSFSSTPQALLHIQATHFTCGGFCLCVQQNHMLSDGVSEFHFLQSWMEILNGKKELSLYPNMDLAILKHGYKLNNSLTPSSVYSEHFTKSPPIEFGAQNTLTFITRIFHFTPNSIKALKQDAKLLHHATNYECIIAYLWQNVIKARGYSSNEETRLAYPVDIRKRLNPPLPLGYFGNALFTGFAYARVGDLLEKPLPYAMSCIREATSIMTSDYMKQALDWLEKQHSPPVFSVASHKSLFANSWTQLRMYELNFLWGKPCCFRTHLPPELAGEYVLILPVTLDKGFIDVQVNLQSEHMHKFQNLIMRMSKL